MLTELVRHRVWSIGVLRRRPAWLLVFLASAFGLFLELALVRWVSCEIRVFAYCKNLVLVACFLGFGAGCLLSKRRSLWTPAMFALLVLTLLVRLPWGSLVAYGPRRVTNVLAELSGLMIFRSGEPIQTWGLLRGLAFGVGWTTILFFLVAFLMVPFGQATARGISQMRVALVGYSVNVLGSLVGIVGYTLTTFVGLSPLWWFAPVILACAWLPERRFEQKALLGIALATALVLLPNDGPNRQEYWSPYQKLAVHAENLIVVNNIGYQTIQAQAGFSAAGKTVVTRWNMPYLLREPPGRVLIVGAGAGNDAAAALVAGATAVTAVEIDPTIYRIGRKLHPEHPYSDPRVRVVIDDARHFLKQAEETFDVIVFSHLDAHSVLSSYTNVQLDNYIYTVEAFREARQRLAPGGLLYVAFFSELPYVSQRLGRNLREAFGTEPIMIDGSATLRSHEVHFIAGAGDREPALRAMIAGWRDYRLVRYDLDTIVSSTDRWPFLPLDRPRIPPIMLAISLAILLLSGAFAFTVRPRGEPFDGHVFWLGAAFMLLEVHNVSRLALVFGTTWQVTAWVIGVILGLILLANAVSPWLAKRHWGRHLAILALFASLAVAYWVPLEVFQSRERAVAGLAATLMLCLPIFFAGLVFADAFTNSPIPGFALGWNVLGAVVGGMTENLSYVWGIPALVPVAASFYAAAFLWRRGRKRIRPALSAPA
jgi:spermidine synthase